MLQPYHTTLGEGAPQAILLSEIDRDHVDDDDKKEDEDPLASAKSQKTCKLFELFGAFLPVTQASKHPQAQQESQESKTYINRDIIVTFYFENSLVPNQSFTLTPRTLASTNVISSFPSVASATAPAPLAVPVG
jgi:hypothetical protein